MTDPLAQIVTLLHPSATLSKTVEGAGRWRLRRTDVGEPFYCVVLQGRCLLAAGGDQAVALEEGDFVLIPAADDFTLSSIDPLPAGDYTEPTIVAGRVRLGSRDGPAEVVMLVGHCTFRSPDAALLIALLPRLVHVSGEKRLGTLVELVGEETWASRPARELVLARLIEVLLIEALRLTARTTASPGLLRGLADPRLAVAIRGIHEQPGHGWTVLALAQKAALSRSSFFDRFRRAVGSAPMEYLLTWRMALAQDMLRQEQTSITEIARRVGYGSASAFSVAFARRVGVPPGRYSLDHSATPGRRAFLAGPSPT